MHRYSYDNILNHTDECGTQLCVNGCPLSNSIERNIKNHASVFLRHKNGYRIPVSVRTIPIVEKGCVVGALEYFQVQQDRVGKMYNLDELQYYAHTDRLTELPNRHYLEPFLLSRINEHSLLFINFSVLFLDIDHFKKLNDEKGHEAGDLVLQAVAKTFQHNIRSSDRIGRWGGDEFVGVCMCRNQDELWRIAEKLRLLVAKTVTMVKGEELRVTLSVGATMYRSGETFTQLIDRADRLLYQSKKDGRNRVTIG